MLKFIAKNFHQHKFGCLIILKKLLTLLLLFSQQMDYLVSFLNHLFLVIRFKSFNIYLIIIIIRSQFDYFYIFQFIDLLSFMMLSEIINQLSFKFPFFELHFLLNSMLKSFYLKMVNLISKSLLHFFLSSLGYLKKSYHLNFDLENFYFKYYCGNLILEAERIADEGFLVI